MTKEENQKEKILCFFHANCVDGAASAAVIRKKYPEAKLYPMNYGEPIRAAIKNRKLFIVDFSFEENVLKALKAKAKEIYWYDHHKTAVPTQKSLGWGVMDLDECGATLTWKQEFPDKPLPKILEYVRDKDLYTWKLPDSREISMHLRHLSGITNPSSPTWERLLKPMKSAEWKQMIHEGKLALEFQKKTLQQGLKNAFAINFHGHKTLVVNWNLEASDMGEYIYTEKGYEIALMFYYTGKEWNFSLRSDRVDVSEIAKQYGGGGHPGASGFRQNNLDFLFKLQKKK